MKVHRLGIVLCSLLVLSACSRAVLQSSVTPHPVSQNVIQPDTMGYFLPKGLIRVQLKPKATNDLELTTSVRYIQDPNYFYTFQYLPKATFDDAINVKLTEQGFLDTIDVTTTDRTREIVGKVIEIAKEVAKIQSIFPGAVAQMKAKINKIPNIDVEFDPDLFLNDDRKEERKRFEGRFFEPYKLEVQLKRTVSEGSVPKQGPADQKGIYYRPLLPYELSFSFKSFDLYKNETISLPNEAPIMAIDLTRAPFIKKAMTLNFNNGILTQIKIDKPSEVSAALDIPLDIAKAIVSLPTEVIQFKFNAYCFCSNDYGIIYLNN